MGQGEADVNAGGTTSVLHLRLTSLNVVEVKGIPGVEVKCLDIRRKIGGERTFLGHY